MVSKLSTANNEVNRDLMGGVRTGNALGGALERLRDACDAKLRTPRPSPRPSVLETLVTVDDVTEASSELEAEAAVEVAEQKAALQEKTLDAVLATPVAPPQPKFRFFKLPPKPAVQ